MDIPSPPLEITPDVVEEALRKWHKVMELGALPLASLQLVGVRMRNQQRTIGTAQYKGSVLAQLLDETLESLQFFDADPTGAQNHWRPYEVLVRRFKLGRTAQECGDELGISKRTVDRDVIAGCTQIAARLLEWEAEVTTIAQPDAATPVGHRFVRSESIITIGLDTSTSLRTLEVEAVSQPLNRLSHRRYFAGESVEDWQLSLENLAHEGGGEISLAKLPLTGNFLKWFVNFDPPLYPGQRAKFAMRQVTKTTNPRTYEDVQARARAGISAGVYESYDLSVIAPTTYLAITIVFPRGYEVKLPPGGGYAVTFGGADAHNEFTRLGLEQSFDFYLDPVRQAWIYKLVVHNALLGYLYHVRWQPPLAADVAKLRADAKHGQGYEGSIT